MHNSFHLGVFLDKLQLQPLLFVTPMSQVYIIEKMKILSEIHSKLYKLGSFEVCRVIIIVIDKTASLFLIKKIITDFLFINCKYFIHMW